jgi:hypothetical protein
MTKLTQDDKDLIAGMMAGDEWKVVEKVCQMVVEKLQVDVINANIREGGREIVLRKAKLDGASEVARYINNIRSQLRKEGLD